MRAPILANESDRLAALRATAVLDTPAETEFDEIAAVAAEICTAPVSLVSMIDARRLWIKAGVGTRVRETSRELSFCGHAVSSPALLEVPDTVEDARFADNAVVRQQGIRFYTGAPVMLDDGLVVGTVCVADQQPRRLGPQQRRTLRLLADHAGNLLDRRRQAGRTLLLEHRLGQLEQLKATFLDRVNHELRTPLTSLSGRLEVLLDSLGELTPEALERHLTVMRRNADRLQHLAEDVGLVAQVDAGGVELRQAPVDLGSLAGRVVAACEPLAVRRAVPVRAVTTSGPVKVQGDEHRLFQALRHLVVNAITFTVGDGCTVVAVDGSDATAVRVSVTDSGIGIPPALLPHVFAPFGRSAAGEAMAVQGLGLGLATVRAIIDAHGGDLDVDSTPGVGTTVRFCLPRWAG